MKKLALIFVLTAVILSFSQVVLAQIAPPKQWDKTFGGTLHDMCVALQQTSDGGYILGGYSESGITGDKTQASKGSSDYWVIKLSANGTKIWDKTIGGTNGDQLKALQQTSDGGYILGGISGSGVGGDKTQPTKGGVGNDLWIVKLDANGTKIWDKTLGTASNDELNSIRQTADGGYIVGAESISGINGDKTQASQGGIDYWVLKLDATGNKLWDKAFGGNDHDNLESIQQTSDGGYIVGGYSMSGLSGDKSEASKGFQDYWVVKLDASGNNLWDRTLGGNAYEFLFSLQQTSDGGYIVGGSSSSPISGDKSQVNIGLGDYWVVKLDAAGNKTWDKTFGGNEGDELKSIKQTTDGGYILGGISKSGISGDKTEGQKGTLVTNDYWVLKLDVGGNKIWDKTIGGNQYDYLTAIQETSDAGIILGGYSDSPVSGDKSQPNVNGIATFDYWIVKLGPTTTGINENNDKFSVKVFPNPNSGSFSLQLNDLNSLKAEIKVIDLLGNIILQQELEVVNKQITQDITLPVSKGMYLLQLKTGNRIITRKIVVE